MDARKKRPRAKSQKLNPGWRPGRKKRRRNMAATMIQKCFRSYLLRMAFNESRNAAKDSFHALRAFHHARNRNHYRKVDLHALSRDELRLIALSLNLPSTGKKVLLMGRIQRWVDQNIISKNIAVDAAAKALEKQVRAQGTIYFCDAIPRQNPIEIRPLRGKNLTRVSAGHECDVVYAIDGRDGSAWLCKTGGLSSQVGLCSQLHQKDVFDHPLESRWLVNPVFLHTLRTEHIIEVQVARSHAIALARAGEIFSWGENQHGQLGYPALSADDVSRNRAKVVGGIANYQCVSVGVGTHHTVAVCNQVAGRDGVIFAWGSNLYGQLGTGAVSSSSPKKQSIGSTQTPTPGSSNQFPKPFVLHRVDAIREVVVRKVACGALHSIALSSEGKVFTWGCNDGGRLGLGVAISRQEQRICRPTQVTGQLGRLRVLEIACGAWHSACIAQPDNQSQEEDQGHIKGGRAYMWGTGIYGQLGAGESNQVLYYPTPIRIPQQVVEDEEMSVQIACGMHHTAVLTAKNNVFTWGSMNSFSAIPQKLRLAHGVPFGKIASIACGRTFTVFNTLSLTSQSYEREEAYRLWRAKETIIPKLDLSKLPKVPLSSSCPGIDHPLPIRLEPEDDRKRRIEFELAEKRRIDSIDIHAIVHPLCRVCWRCDGFQPSPLKLWICRHCFHEKDLHGIRPEGTLLTEYEAVRKIQCLYRARRAKRILQQAREKHYQRVFSIKHDSFFYYNLWRDRSSWDRPPEIPEDVDIPIRDPDDLPHIRPPLTKDEAAIVLQKHWRGHVAHVECKKRLCQKYEKHYDLKKERVYYRVIQSEMSRSKQTAPAEQRFILWEEPMLLRRLYDLGEPIEITRLKRFANMTPDDAAQVIQKQCRRYQARQRVKRAIQSRFRKLFDEKTGQHYYYNVVTKVSTWDKPSILKSPRDELEHETATHTPAAVPTSPHILKPKRQPRKSKFDSQESAARTIQALFHRYRSRKMLFDLLRRRYLKIMDEVSQCPYYYDRKTGTSSWLKPTVFGTFDLELHGVPTLSSRDAMAPRESYMMGKSYLGMVRRNKRKQVPYISEKARIKREKRRLQKLRQFLTPHEAACCIQRAWRVYCARKELRSRLLSAYEKIFDDVTGQYYYHNRKTGTVSWEKPAILEESEVRVARVVKRRREHTITEEKEATMVIVGFGRRCLARMDVLRRLCDRVEKVYDTQTKQYYYFDKLTGQSSWKKPLLLGDRDLPTHN